MATLQTSLSEYLRTSYHSDRDYVDGEVQERNLGEFDHAAVQVFLSRSLSGIDSAEAPNMTAFPEGVWA